MRKDGCGSRRDCKVDSSFIIIINKQRLNANLSLE